MTAEELLAIAESERQAKQQLKYCVHVCSSTGCASSNSEAVAAALQQHVKEAGLQQAVQVNMVGCMGLCALGPLVEIEQVQVQGGAPPTTVLYQSVTPADAPEIVSGLVSGQAVQRLRLETDDPFFTRQTKVVLAQAGRIDPERLEDYVADRGYQAVFKALTDMTPAEVIEEVTKSGLRGRGGGGYPTGLKWNTVAKVQSDQKYLICNADEGDPGAFMDRSILESNPHLVIEGMIIGAYAVGASKGYVYVRAEYPLAVKRMKQAIRQAERAGFLGQNICGADFSFNVEIRLGAGAFVCGEETALMASIEGRRGTPRPRPPYPAASGLWGKPTLINNVETFANVPGIILDGGEAYARVGTEKSKGTKIFALTGKINHTGLIEVPMGVTLREIIYEIGGGIPDGRKFKAVQTGGPSGGCIPEQFLDTPVDYESLSALGSIMGSGGMIVIDDSSSMIDVAKYFMEFSKEESCGKCVPCRVGTAQMYDLLCKFSAGQATEFDLRLLEDLCDLVKNTSLCGLGQTAPNPVISTLKYFRDEYLAKIKKPEEAFGVASTQAEHPIEEASQ
ncbi:MAG: NuoF family protein [Anaerolineae bacterium]|nr:NAD(P)H-dependent oxidoreductase subunit E [Thermoflexales bacterium]MDW8406657.1 NuoF family protein [Anaerolineae bacterium]